MKIIKEGILPQEIVYKTICRNCFTTFEFKQGEGKINYDQRDGDYISIECPLEGCNNTVNVSVKARICP